MIRIAALAALLAAAPLAATAQTSVYPSAPPDASRVARNTLYVELGGAALLYSVNYERFVSDDLALRVGGSVASFSASDASGSASVSFFMIPVTASYLGVTNGNHSLELGGGLLIISGSGEIDDSDTSTAFTGTGAAGTGIVGYRYAPRAGGFNFRAAFTPIFGQGGFQSWFGVAFGYGF